MPSRKSYARSHHGCAQCKKRRVKCDETLPVCNRCERRGEVCVRVNGLTPGFEQVHPRPTKQSSTASTCVFTEPFVGRPSSYNKPASSATGKDSSSDSMQHFVSSDLPWDELDQNTWTHFKTATSDTLCYRAEMEWILKDAAFRLAPTRPSVIHCLLAFASHHILATEAARRPLRFQDPAALDALKVRLLHHQNHCLNSFQSEIFLNNSEDDNIATCLVSIVLPIISLASQQLQQDCNGANPDGGALDKAAEFLRLESGTHVVFRERWAQVSASPLVNLRHTLRDPDIPESSDADEALSLLHTHCMFAASTDGPTRDLHAAAIEGLCRLFRAALRSPCDIAHRFAWIRGAQFGPFAALIDERQPETLLILAYWAVGLHEWKDAWWEMGLGRALVQEIVLQLPRALYVYMEWPTSRVGLHLSQPSLPS